MKENITEKFNFTTPTKQDLDDLKRIWESCKYIEDWTDDNGDPDESIKDFFIQNTNLPPGGIKENSIISVISLITNNEIIGYIQYYLGYPDKNTIWLTTLIIGKEYQKRHFGKEVLEKLLKKLQERNEFNKIQLIVSLKNWPALRFWTRNGFFKIVDIKGDKEHKDNSFAHIILEKHL